LRDHQVAQFGGAAFASTFVARRKRHLPGPNLGITAFIVLVGTLGELLNFIVNSRLPIERLKQSITSVSRVGIRLAAVDWSSVDLS
jgi:hypothetical protein